VLYQDALPFTAGLDVTFSFYDYDTVPTFVSSGADGVSFFLADGSQPLEVPGGFGGSLGYAQTTGPFPVDGILGGYLGVGFDEYDNFGNNLEGRGAGCSQSDSGFYPNYWTLRGPGTGQSGYCILDRVSVGSLGAVGAPSAKRRTAAGVKRTVHIVVDPPAQANAHILVQMDFGSGMQTIMDAPEHPIRRPRSSSGSPRVPAAPTTSTRSMPPSSTRTVTVVARVGVLKPGKLTDTAAVTADGPDPDPSTDHATAVVRILAAPLTITKRASATHVHSGSAVSFTIRVTNRSDAAVNHVTVCDRLPAGLNRISGGTVRGTRVCWTVSSLAASASRSFVMRAGAVSSRTQAVTNVATVGGHGIATRSARATVVIFNPVPSFTG
jgi:uncharacterized repeat protein (TIGR01451 family)